MKFVLRHAMTNLIKYAACSLHDSFTFDGYYEYIHDISK